MAKSNTSFKKGESGNPSGRPQKNRALTEILESVGNSKVEFQQKQLAQKQILAQMLWQVAVNGKTTTPDGTNLTVAPEDWFGVVKFLYTHIDGPAKTEVDVTSDGEKLNTPIVFLPAVTDDASNDS